MKRILLLFLMLLSITRARGQASVTGAIQGRIFDSQSHLPLSSATIYCLHMKDSSQADLTFSDKNGNFSFPNIKRDRYILYIKYLGYETLMYPLTELLNINTIDIGSIILKKTGLTLAPVEIIETKSPLNIRKDTIEFAASYFKTRTNSSLEELLKKIPGVQIDNDGTIRLNGEVVKSIFINGRPLFDGGDINLVTKNLQADLIDKIQLISKEPNTGDLAITSDGKKIKTINLTIKENKQNLLSGETTIGVSTDKNFGTKLNLSKFTNSQQLLAVLNGDNMNGALEGMGSNLIGKESNKNVGINYNKYINAKISADISYLMKDKQNSLAQKSARETFTNNSNYFYDQQINNTSSSTTNSININFRYKIDSTQSIYFNTNLLQSTESSALENIYSSYSTPDQAANSGTMNISTKRNSESINSTLKFEKIFQKKNNPLSILVGYSGSSGKENTNNLTQNVLRQTNNESTSDTIKQNNFVNRKTERLFFSIDYDLPLYKSSTIQLKLASDYNLSPLTKKVYGYNAASHVIDNPIDSLGNNFNTISFQKYIKAAWHIQKKKYDFTFSFAILLSEISNNDIQLTPNTQIKSTSLLPGLTFNYSLTNSKTVHFIYKRNPKFPSLNSLQPIQDNTNLLYIKLGNPSLKPEQLDNITLSYDNFNPNNMRFTSISIDGNFSKDQIINGTSSDSSGRQIIQPLNATGAHNFGLNITTSIPTTGKKAVFSTVTNCRVGKDINFVNGDKGYYKNLTINQSVKYEYLYNKSLDFYISAALGYNSVGYSNSRQNNNQYFNYSFIFNGNINLPFGVVVNGFISYIISNGQSSEYNFRNLKINASISKFLFSNQQGVIKLGVLDLLNQNSDIMRQVGENYVEDTRSNVQKRLIILKFSYFFGKGKRK
ncbi:TonB-dependent receptor [Chitinophaga eiseniae]|uniref:Outer membrane beta-barrel protein n=1 Tax=Chitinophaga eiseniae TaxID=634771 RepID=A0A847SR15_9BACT|nr:TonB-dependent receptor [Chitinophaga eiseniae]NLR81427.1 outer membrane beta-barrel protein [Chitinophaga eiseniae]